jgi:anti-anti-sigma factor
MKITYSDLEPNLRVIKLSGTMDLGGVSGVEVEFIRLCASDQLHVIVDMAKVSYLSSMGLPLLVNGSRALAKRGGKMVLLSPRPNVMDVLETTGLNLAIPIFKNITAAKSALLAIE